MWQLKIFFSRTKHSVNSNRACSTEYIVGATFQIVNNLLFYKYIVFPLFVFFGYTSIYVVPTMAETICNLEQVHLARRMMLPFLLLGELTYHAIFFLWNRRGKSLYWNFIKLKTKAQSTSFDEQKRRQRKWKRLHIGLQPLLINVGMEFSFRP
jgi:hypothetical protein